MKMFKKLSLIILCTIVLVLITGCTNNSVDGSLEDIMAKVYADIPENERPMYLTNTKVTDENIEYYLGTKDIKYEEALASESSITSIAHSVVLVRIPKDASVEEAKTKIKTNINSYKWICTGVPEDQVIIKNKGNLIILIMTETDSDKIEKAFDNL